MKKLSHEELKNFLDKNVRKFNTPAFIENDPVLIPHRFQKKQDIEIAGLFAALLAWGQRVTIINKCTELLERMDNSPYDFVRNHSEADLKKLAGFAHRTFNEIDVLYFVEALQKLYTDRNSLEFYFQVSRHDRTIEKAIASFHESFFSLPDHPHRTKKHLPTPVRKSSCKRINMYLRWMVRRDNCGVDFGIWKKISPAQLICPLDVHVDRIARKFKLIKRKQTDWETALELTSNLRLFDPLDPVKYDFALFGIGVEERRRSARL